MTEARAATDVLLVAYVHNRPGVLAKIAGMFYRRGLNIRTLTVGGTQHSELSKMVVRVAGPRSDLERLVPSIGNLVDVLTVEMHEATAARAQELCLIRVGAADRAERDAVLAAAAPFQPVLVDAAEGSIVLESAGTPAAIDFLIETLAAFRVLDVSRTGVTTLPADGTPYVGQGEKMTAVDRNR